VLAAGRLDQMEPKPTHAHTSQECLAKSHGDAPPCFVLDAGVLIKRSDDPAT
jgi:hypothetical protein